MDISTCPLDLASEFLKKGLSGNCTLVYVLCMIVQRGGLNVTMLCTARCDIMSFMWKYC